jgi:carboxymethylenebutenolidase
MKSALLLFAACLCTGLLHAQAPPCCEAPQSMLALAKTEDFTRAHEAPEPFQYETPRGTMLSFETLDGNAGRAYYVPSQEATSKVLIIFHEWWGLNDYIRREADRWQDSLGAVDVYAIDLYDGKVAVTQEQASKLASSLDKRRTDVLIKGLLAKSGRDNIIATLGWCLGGGYAFRSSVLAEKQAAGCVMYYGFPEKDVKSITPLQCDVLYIRASQDAFITQAMITPFVEQVKQTGKAISVETYNAAHAFANPSNPKFDGVAATDAQQKALAFIRSHLAL